MTDKTTETVVIGDQIFYYLRVIWDKKSFLYI